MLGRASTVDVQAFSTFSLAHVLVANPPVPLCPVPPASSLKARSPRTSLADRHVPMVQIFHGNMDEMLSMYAHIITYITYIYIWIHTYMRACLGVISFICVCIRMCVYIYIYVCVCVCVSCVSCVCVCSCKGLHMYVYVYMYVSW